MSIRLKTEEDLKFLRISGGILARVLETLMEETRVGVALKALDARARELLAAEGATPAFLGYVPEGMIKSYPAAICASLNDTIVHGIPGRYVLREGDLLKIDIGVIHKGYFTDGAATVAVGTVSENAKKLMHATQNALHAGIAACRPGGYTGDIGFAISEAVKKEKFAVVKGLTGHGVGFSLHEDPSVPNQGERGRGVKLVPGLVIAIEPMVSAGSPFAIAMDDESFRTKDGSLSAHFEHTVAITESGVEILTQE
ncbi:MAG: type I methionyl aminopeptidase [Patescibacteria group bacterium]